MSDIGAGWFSRKRAAASTSTSMPKPRPRRTGIMVLEPRMMYDAAAPATIAATTQGNHDAAADPAAAAAADKSTAAVTTNSGADTTATDSKTTTSNVQASNVQASNTGTGSTGSDSKTSSLDASNTSAPAAGPSPSEIVFIDQQAPDYQMLAAGVKDGVTAVILDPTKDGLTQIADYLSSHPNDGLTTIDIVAHGQDGMLFLGNGVLANETIGQYTAQLKTIGAALKNGGDLMLYGCDIGENADGLILMQRIVDITGADVAGSTGPVGAADRGGSWSLNVTAGAITSAAPFTDETLSHYEGLLNAQLFGIVNDGGSGNGIVYATDGNGSTTGGATGATIRPISFGTGGSPRQIQLDVADGLYFVMMQTTSATPGSFILEGSLSQVLSGGTPTFTTVYSDTNANNDITSFQVDAADNAIFFSHRTNAFSASYSSEFEVISFSGAHFSGTPTVHNISGSLAHADLRGMVVDPVHQAAYFYQSASTEITVGSGGQTRFGNPATIHGGLATKPSQQHIQTQLTQDQLFKASWSGSNSNPVGFSLATLPIAAGGNTSTLGANNFPTSLGRIADLAIDATNQVLYFDTTTLNGSSAGIFKYSLTGNATGSFSTVWTQTSTVPGLLADLIIDTQTNKYYVSVNDGSVVGKNAIYDGSLTGGAAPALFSAVNSTDAARLPLGLAIDEAPILTLGGSGTPTYTEQGTAAVPLAGSLQVTAADSDTTTLSGATISIGGFVAGDTLAFSSLPTGISASYNSATGVMTLTGVANLASYGAAFEALTFASTSDNPTNYGAATSRTLSYSVTDGLLTSNSVSTSVNVVAVNDAPVNHLPASPVTATEDGSLAITGMSVTDVDSNPAADVIQVVLSVQQGTLTLLTGVAGGLTGGQIAGNGSATVTLTATQNQINATLAAANGLKYLSNGNFNGSDALTITSDDQGHTGSPGALQTQNTLTINISPGNDAPDLTPNSPTAVSYIANTPTPVALLATGAVTDIDGPANFAGGSFTITIDTGGQGGDQIVLLSSSGFTASGGVLKDSGGNTVGSITGLNGSSMTVGSLTSFATPAEVNALVEAFGFKTSSGGGDRSLKLTFNDGGNVGGGPGLTDTVTQIVHVTVANIAPTLDLGATPGTVPERTATALAPSLTLSDVDGNTLLSAKVQLTTGYVSGEDVLGFTNTANIQGAFVAATGTLTITFSGTPTDGEFQTFLRSVTYTDTSHTPTTASRTVVFTVQDAGGTANSGHDTTVASATFNVSAVNEAPVLSQTSNTVGFTENGTAVQLLPTESVSDPDLPANFNNGSVLVTLTGSVAGDGIGLLASSGFTVNAGVVKDNGTTIGTVHAGTGFGTASVQVDLNTSATAAEVAALLKALSYASSSDDPTGAPRTATVTFNDGGNTGSGVQTAVATVTINVTPVNDAPTLSATGANPAFTEGGAAATLFSGALASTIEAGQTITALRLTVSNVADGASEIINIDGHDVPLVNGTVNAGTDVITVSISGTTATVTLTNATGISAAATASLVNAITYRDTSDNPNTANRTVTLTAIKDNGGTSPGVDTTALSIASTVSVGAVNDAPTATLPGTHYSATERTPLDLKNTLSVADVDGNNGIETVTLSVTEGTLTLAAGTSGATITNNGSAAVTINGTVAQINDLLNTNATSAVSYIDNSHNPAAHATLTLTINDNGNTGSGVTAPGTATAIIDIAPVNDAPVLDPAKVPALGAIAEDAGAPGIGSGILVASLVDLNPPAGGLDNVTDVDSTVTGIALIGADSSHGTWLYSIDNGAHWAAVGSVSDGSARLLAADGSTRLYFQPAADFNGAVNPALTFRAWDRSSGSNGDANANAAANGGATAFSVDSVSTSLVVTPVNDAPVLTVAGTHAAGTEQVFGVLDGSATVSDKDLDAFNGGAGDYSGASLIIARHSGANAQDAFAFGASALFTVSGNELQSGGQAFATFTSVGGVLTINFTSAGTAATTALVNDVIDHVTYANQSDTPPPSVTLDINFSDGNGNGAQGAGGRLIATAGRTIDITAVNDAPVNTVPGSQTALQDTSLAIAGLSVFDVDADPANDIVTVTLGVGHGSLTVATDQLTGLNESIGGNGTGSVILTGTQDHINATLAEAGGLVYLGDLGFSGNDVLTVTTDDGGHTGTGPGVATGTVSILVTPTANVNAPQLALTDNGSFTEGQASPASVVTAATVTDTSATTLEGATVTISGGFLAGDTLTAGTTIAGITASYANGVLTLSGHATLADYNTVLSSIQFSTASHNPTLYGTDATRTLTWIVNDGSSSGSTTSTIAVTGVDDAPVNQVPGAQTASEDRTLAITGLSVSDVDANPASDIITVTLSVGHGSLTAATNLLTGIGESVTGNGSGSVTLTGTQHDINATLAEANGLVYLGDTNFNGSDSLTIVTDDGGHTPAPAQQATDHVAINVLSVNDAPSGADTTVSVIVNTSRVLTAGDFHFNDVDGNSLQAVEITSLPTAGSLTNHGTAVFAGQFISLADITGGNLVFTPAAGGPASPYATFTFQVQDDGGTANGGVDLDPVARTITLNTVVSQPPVLSNVAPTAAFTENDPAPVLLSSGLDVTDSDSPNLSKATVTISAGLLAGDELSIAGSMTGVSGTISWNFSGGTLTLQGLATAADYKTLLDQVAYRSTSADPTNGGADGSRSIDWVATDSAGVPSLAATTHVTVTAVNNDPVASIATPNYGPVDEQASLSLKNTGISVGDVDGNTGSETVTLAVDDGILNVTAGTSGATVLNSGTSSVTITGSVAQIQALLNTDPTSTVAFVDTNHTPHASVALTLTIHDNGSTGGTDLSSVATATIAVNPVNDAPVASITQPVYNAVEQTVLDLHGTGISVSDVDSQGGTETVTLSVGEGTLALNAGSTGAIVSGPGASVTITGTLAQINAVLNGDLASSLTYIDNTDTPGAGTTLTLAVDDQGNTGAPGARIGTASVTIVIAPVDDAPTTADAVVTISEDATRTFAASDFPFADVENNALQSVIIAGLPAHGTLTLNGSTFAAGTSIAAAQIANLVYTPNADFNGTDTFTFKVQDNGNGNGLGQDISAVATMTVTVNSVNDAPTAAASSVTTSEDAPRTFLASDFGFTDAHDNPPNALQAVIIETLPANGTLKLNGIDVTANQTILASDLSNLVYTPNADFNGTDGFTFDVRDDGGTALGGHDTSTNAALMSISVVSVNDAPTAAASARTIDEDTPVNFAASDFHFTDAHDNPSNALQAVVIGALPGSGTLTLNGHAVAANDTILATDLANLVYTPNLNFNGSDTFTFAVRDDGGTALGGHDTSTNTATMTITVNPVNDAPVLSGVKTSAAFTPGGMAVTLSPPPVLVTDPALSVTDVDNTTLAGATVRVSAGTFLGDGDVLSVNGATVGNIGAITFSYNAGNETLTLTGTDTLAHYQQVLEQVQFLSTSFNPTNSGAATSRTIIWQLDDGSGAGNHNLSAPVDSQIFLHTLDLDSATAGTDYAAAYTEGGTVAGGTAAAIANLAVITDNDSDIASATVTLVNARPTDLLSFVGAVPPGITVSGNGTSVLTFTGTALKGVYEQLLDDVRFSSTSGNIDTTIRDVAVSVTDLGGIETNIAHTAISITAVNDAPTVDPHGGSLAYTENDAPTPIDPLLTITDPDSANINGATVKITGNFHASEDVLGFANQNGISGSYDSVHGVLTLTGASSVANYEAALKSVTYFNSSDKPSNQARTISFQAVDDGGASSTVATATVSVAPVNDAPVMTGLTASVGFTENGAPVTLSPGITVADVDSSLLTGAKVAITGGFVDGDTLDVVAGGTITASYDGATGVLTLTGQATPAQYRAVLASISFTSTSDNPTSFGTRPTRTITWSLTDLDETSAAHANATGTAVTHVAVTAINDAPVIDAGQTLPFNANAGLPMAIDPAIALHDVDSLTLVGARVAVVGGFEAANDSLGFVNQHGIAGTYDSATGVLTLSGTASVADYQAALASVTFASITQASANRTIQWTVDDGGAVSRLSAPAMSTLNVSGIILPPHVFTDNHAPPAQTQGFTPASFVDSGPRGPLVPLTGGDSFGNGFGTGGSGNGFHVVHTDAVLTTASDATVQINLALAALEAPLGGDIAYVVARQANGDPLPDWLKFDPATGTFAGLPPDNLVASIEPEQSLDNNIVTGALPLRPDLGITGPNAPAKPLTITVEVLARDSKGNIAVTVFTIDLRTHTAGKQGWNIDRNARPLGGERHASLPMISPELAAIEAALRDVAREPWVSRGTSVRHGDSISAGSGESTPAGRAGLTEQLASIGWRSMAAQRNALLASLQQPR